MSLDIFKNAVNKSNKSVDSLIDSVAGLDIGEDEVYEGDTIPEAIIPTEETKEIATETIETETVETKEIQTEKTKEAEKAEEAEKETEEETKEEEVENSMTNEIKEIQIETSEFISDVNIPVYNPIIDFSQITVNVDLDSKEVFSLDLRDTSLNPKVENVNNFKIFNIDDTKMLLSTECLRLDKIEQYCDNIIKVLESGVKYRESLIIEYDDNKVKTELSYKEICYVLAKFKNCRCKLLMDIEDKTPVDYILQVEI